MNQHNFRSRKIEILNNFLHINHILLHQKYAKEILTLQFHG